MIFNESKYTKIYFNIINKRISSPATEGEIHHIIPRSIGGSDDSSNLVKLSYREHLVCHILLTKMCESENKIKMCWALHRLTFSKKIYSSHQYELARKIHIKNLIENHPSKNEDWIDKVSTIVYDHWKDNAERRQKTSDRMKKNWEDNKEKLVDHNRKIAKLGAAAAKDVLAKRIEYRGKMYLGWKELYDKTGISKHLYNKYYLNGINPELRLGTNGPIPR